MTNAAVNPTSNAGASVTRAYWTHKLESATGPVAQFRMAQLIDYDRRLTDPARTVYRFLIGWYMHAKHGDALASVRHIVTTMRGRAPDGARHLSRSAVQRAIILLIDCGWLVRTHIGKGRAGSRYVPVLNVLELASQGTLPDAVSISVPDHRDTTDISLASRSTGTVLSRSTGTQIDLASRSTGTKTLLLDPPTDGATVRENDPAAPTAPPLADGLTATGAGGTAVEGLLPTFEVLWRTYGFARGKKAARRAWSALPIEVDRAAVIRAASEWQASWAAQGNPDAPRKHLATWLMDECYDEDAPKGFVRVEKPGKIQPKPRQLAAPTTTNITGALRAPPPIIAKKIVAAGVERKDGERLLSIEFEEGGSHSITLEANDSSTQAEGQREFGLLLDSVGLSEVDDPAQLVGRTVHVQGGQFVPKPDDDDDTIIDQAA